jgi:hypothetical protein
MDINDPVTVYTITDPVKAEIIRTYLQGEGIRCRLDGAHTSANMALGSAAFPIGILVPAADADRARELIEQHEAHRGKSRPYGDRDHLHE